MANDESTKAFSFSFARKVDTKKLADSKLRDESTKDVEHETDFVQSMEDKEINSSIKREKKKELVIPLIKENRWHLPRKSAQLVTETNGLPENVNGSLEEQAAQELLSESNQAADHWEARGSKKEMSHAIPLIVQNKVPDGYETDEHMDVSLRPDEATLDDYENVPIEQYGMAVLRGMGWKPGQGIGRKKLNVAPMEAVIRPKGLGLGADRRVVQKKLSANEKDEDLSLVKGAYVMLEKGSQKGLYGQVEGIDEDNARVVVRLTLSNRVVTVSNYCLHVVTKKEYKECSKVLNKDKYDEYKNKQEQQRKEQERESSKRKHDEKEHGHRKKHKEEKREKKEKHKEKKAKEEISHRKSSSPWVRPYLQVRCVDRKYKQGKFYSEKMTVIDVASADVCICRTSDGLLLEDVPPSALETVIPKVDPAHVMIVTGKHRGQLGEIIARDKNKWRAQVQLLPDRDEIIHIDYDSICEYLGDTMDF